ncbi:anhydro-N-acetylmuramic acid kinase [Celeribacter litoreus]|uniref:anhydro-N-acetylmuramic acid kinase n=1 Tax=Celeribacter litoreus TaxID=2876714 RepID=UPI001CCC4DE5|nr:anhydro-N-acetylmuramic acid kinase [Celeribacter litoreus]MCA0044723.1 anhydro-N-acetylmuramic acid kinase [Celeribacter litoreus]
MTANTQAKSIRVAGCMSGTSLDGVDIAILETDGETIVSFGPGHMREYTEAEQSLLRSALGTWEASAEVTDLIESAHAEALTAIGEPFDLVAFHGQTFNHAPHEGRTYQAGDGSVLADTFGVPVVWDFRTADVEMGGQGAPLAPFYHHALARHIGAEEPVAFLNMGGVGNLTWIDPSFVDPAAEGALLAFDTGPANAPVNDLMLSRLGLGFDEDGALAASGQVEAEIVAAFLERPYFAKEPPKSLDRNDFHSLLEAVKDLPDEDAAATLTACAVAAVVEGVKLCPVPPSAVYVGGGGRLNATLMGMLDEALACPVLTVEDIELDGDLLEAQAFAFLAVRILRGLPTSAPRTTGVRLPIGGGRVSEPTE